MGYHYDPGFDANYDHNVARRDLLCRTLEESYDRCICEIELSIALKHYEEELREYAYLIDVCYYTLRDALLESKRGES